MTYAAPTMTGFAGGLPGTTMPFGAAPATSYGIPPAFY